MKNDRLRVRALSCALAAVAFLPLPAFAGDLRLSTLLPLTGPYANYSVEFRLGMEIGRDEINTAGGVGGEKIQLEVLDTQSNNGQVVSLIRKACGSSFAVLGPSMSNEAQVAFPIANAMACPAISSSAAASGLTDKNRPWTFTYASPASIITPQAVELLVDKLGVKRAVVVIDRGDAAANDQGAIVERTLKEKGVASQTFTISSSDLEFSPVVTRIRGETPDLVVLSTTDKGAVSVLKELKRTGSDAKVLITQSAFTPLITAAGPQVIEGVYRYTEFDPTSSQDPRVMKFVESFQARNNGRAPTQLATQAYDLVYLVKHLVEEGKLTGTDQATARKIFVEDLAKLTDWQSISGPMSISPQGYAVKPVTVLVFRDGKPQKVSAD